MNKFLIIFLVNILLVGTVSAVPPDNNNDGCVTLGEISSYVASWLSGGGVTLGQVSTGVSWWMQGCTPSSTFSLPASASINWQPGIPGGIPNYPVGVNIMNYGAVGNGVADDTPALKNAIAAAPSGTAVYFPPGIYKLTSLEGYSISKSIVLRGAGPDQTKISLAGTDGLLFLGGGKTPLTTVTSGYTKGSKQVTVSDSSNFIVGQYFQIEPGVYDPAVLGCIPAGCDTDNLGQISKIISKNGNTLTLETELHYNYTAAMNPQARNLNLLKYVGIEDLTLVRPTSNGAGGNVEFKFIANCWVRNVWSQHAFRAHVIVNWGYQCEIRDSVFNDAWIRGGGGQGYGTETGFKTSDSLIINNIYWKLRHGAIFSYGPSGNVVAYNYFKDNAAGNSGPQINTAWLPPDSNVHGNNPNMNLYEGNVMNAFEGDFVWGGNIYTTAFRNRIVRESYYVTNPEINIFPYIWIGQYNRHFNIIGNELGKYGQQVNGNGWTNLASSSSGSMLMYTDPADPLANSTTLFHGNYEYLSNSNGAVLHLGWKNGYSQTLPPSLFLTSKPAFFGTLDWPAFGPDKINSGNKIPAQVRYETLAAQNKIGPNFVYVLN